MPVQDPSQSFLSARSGLRRLVVVSSFTWFSPLTALSGLHRVPLGARVYFHNMGFSFFFLLSQVEWRVAGSERGDSEREGISQPETHLMASTIKRSNVN